MENGHFPPRTEGKGQTSGAELGDRQGKKMEAFRIWCASASPSMCLSCISLVALSFPPPLLKPELRPYPRPNPWTLLHHLDLTLPHFLTFGVLSPYPGNPRAEGQDRELGWGEHAKGGGLTPSHHCTC